MTGELVVRPVMPGEYEAVVILWFGLVLHD